MTDSLYPESASSLSGESFSEEQSKQILESAVAQANHLISQFVKAFLADWTRNPPTAIRAVLGFWVIAAFRHLRAAIALAESHDLTKVAEVHYRSMVEIFFQVRFLLQSDPASRERMAQKVSAWGCVDYLEKTDAFKEYKFGEKGHSEILAHLSNYDPALIEEVRKERKDRALNWFGMSFTRLGATVSKPPEDLAALYQMVSAQAHGSWDMVLDVAHPEPGKLDFRGYPNKAQLFMWGGELIDRALGFFLKLWNEVAAEVGAPQVNPPPVSASPFEPKK